MNMTEQEVIFTIFYKENWLYVSTVFLCCRSANGKGSKLPAESRGWKETREFGFVD